MIKSIEDVTDKLTSNKVPEEDIGAIHSFIEALASTTTQKKSFFLKLLDHPSISVALITAVIGPLTLAYLSNENDKAQHRKDIMNKVMTITNGANFDNYNEMIRVGAIASIVNENEEKFGLTMYESEKRFKSLAEDLKTLSKETLEVKVSKLEKKTLLLSNDISSKEQRIKVDNARIEVINVELKTREKELEKIKGTAKFLAKDGKDKEIVIDRLVKEREEKERNSALIETEINNVKLKISFINKSLVDAESELDIKNEQISNLKRESNNRIKEIEKKNAEVFDMITSNTELKKRLNEVFVVNVKYKEKIEKGDSELLEVKDELALKAKKLNEANRIVALLRIKLTSTENLLEASKQEAEGDQKAVPPSKIESTPDGEAKKAAGES